MENYTNTRFARIINIVRSFEVPQKGNKKWLDLGCSDGSFVRLLASLGYYPTGIDVWDPKLKTEDSWEYIQCDLNIKSIPVDSCAYDIISALELIEHIIDTDKLLNEIYRAIKPGGLFILSTPNICMIKNRFRILFGLYPYSIEYQDIIHHFRIYNLHCLKLQLKEHNFRILAAEGEKLLPQKFLNYKWTKEISTIFARIFPTLCANLIVIAMANKE